MSQCADILHEVFEERIRQDIKYGPGHDDLNTYEEWRQIIKGHIDREGTDLPTQKRLLIEVAAIAVAAAQAADRRDATSRFWNGTHGQRAL